MQCQANNSSNFFLPNIKTRQDRNVQNSVPNSLPMRGTITSLSQALASPVQSQTNDKNALLVTITK